MELIEINISSRVVWADKNQDEMKSVLGGRVFGQEEPVSNGIIEEMRQKYGRHFPMDRFQVTEICV